MHETLTEYRIGERSVLRPGTRFRATGGPTFRLKDGTEVSLSARGPFVFRCLIRANGCDLIQASDRDGCSAILHIAGERKPPTPEIIPRPYRIKGLIRKKKARTR